MGQYIKINGDWKRIVSVYKKVEGVWTQQNTYSFDNNIYVYDPTVIDHDVLLIVAEDSYSGKHFYLVAQLNDRRIYPTWTITSGGSYATVNENGKVTILSVADNSLITVQANYKNLVETADILVSYGNQFTIEGPDNIVGTSGNVVALYNNTVVNPTWSITSGSSYATINSSGEITILDNGEITVSATYENQTATKIITVEYDSSHSSHTTVDPNTGAITNSETETTTDPETGATTETTSSTTTNADGSTSETTSETTTNSDGSSTTTSTTTNSDGSSSESTYSTSSPDSDGAVTTTESTTTNNADGTSSTSSSTTVENEDGSSSSSSSMVNYDANGNPTSSTESTTTVSAADSDGAVTTETSTSTTNEDGTSSESSSTVIENLDGSSSSSSQTINYDENGDTTGSTTNTTDVNADGSSQSQTTNYNASGDPTDQQNVGIDTTGNVDTQDIEFDENGDPTVTGYTIDTTASEGEGKEIEGNGINTEFVPFNFASEGFVLHIVFETRSIDQPRPPLVTDIEDSGTNWHYTILGAKMTTTIHDDVTGKDIWPGFEIRWSIPTSGNGSNGTLNFGRTLYGESSSTRTTITNGHNGQNVYDITITYDPSQASSKFLVYNNYTHTNIQNVNKTLQNDVDLDLTIGYSFDHNGDQMRHANVIIHDFSVSRLS